MASYGNVRRNSNRIAVSCGRPSACQREGEQHVRGQRSQHALCQMEKDAISCHVMGGDWY